MTKLLIDASDYENLEDLERLHLEVSSYETIINHLMTSNRKDKGFLKSEIFIEYMNSFQFELYLYNKEKVEFENYLQQILMEKYNYEGAFTWEINSFEAKQAIVTY